MSNEFYIGWQSKAPDSFSRHVKKMAIVLMAIVIILAVLLSLSQKKFTTGNFEFGTLTTVQGFYFSKPVPALKVVNGKDIFGNLSYITIPLIGYGKFGAEGVMADIEKEKKESLDEKEMSLKGTLLYNDGKLLMQIDANDQPLIEFSHATSSNMLPVREELGIQKFRGEILDPKCYFGVMKPGQGKVHKDCAIRCISGGMPPMLRVSNAKGEENYYIIVGEDGERMNDQVKDYVAEPVELNARAVRYDDWIILYVNRTDGIKRIS